MNPILKACLAGVLVLGILYLAGFLTWKIGLLLDATRAEVEGFREDGQQFLVDTRKELKQTVESEMEATRQMVREELGQFIEVADSKIDRTLEEVHTTVQVADSRLASVQMIVDRRLASAQTELLLRVDANLQPIQKSISSFDYTFYRIFTCYDEETGYHNVDCFENRYIGAMQGLERFSYAGAEFMEAWAAAAPRIAANVESMTESGESIAKNVDRGVDRYINKPWHERLLNWGIAAGPALWGLAVKIAN